ncbi:hypothetical protein SFRURICE_014738 [Spodoptera frugiperda]|nr:hypothetical protein SFRURICE_014738 [Spodoptera frugiperda]
MPRGRDEMQVNVAGLRRNIKNLAHNYSDAQVKVREATSNDPWGPSSTLMAEIADLTYNVMAFTEIMQMIWKRLNDHGKNWRHVYKALVLMEYLIRTGSEKVAMQCKENIFAIHTLKDFQYMEEGKDQGQNVREKAKALVNLLKDEERLKNERARALKAKQRFAQSASAFGSDGALDTPSSPSYPAFGSEGALGGLDSSPYPTLQLALAMSREEAERDERRRRSDDVRLQLAISQSQQDFQLVYCYIYYILTGHVARGGRAGRAAAARSDDVPLAARHQPVAAGLPEAERDQEPPPCHDERAPAASPISPVAAGLPEAERDEAPPAAPTDVRLQLAISQSQQDFQLEAERDERRRRSDDVRLQLAISQSQQDFRQYTYISIITYWPLSTEEVRAASAAPLTTCACSSPHQQSQQTSRLVSVTIYYILTGMSARGGRAGRAPPPLRRRAPAARHQPVAAGLPEAERDERRRRSDDVRLQLAISQSQQDFQIEAYLRDEVMRLQTYKPEPSAPSWSVVEDAEPPTAPPSAPPAPPAAPLRSWLYGCMECLRPNVIQSVPTRHYLVTQVTVTARPAFVGLRPESKARLALQKLQKLFDKSKSTTDGLPPPKKGQSTSQQSHLLDLLDVNLSSPPSSAPPPLVDPWGGAEQPRPSHLDFSIFTDSMETSSDAWSAVGSPAKDPWAPAAAADPWAPVAHAKSPVSVLSSPSSSELEQFDALSQRPRNNLNNNTDADPFDLTALSDSLTPKPSSPAGAAGMKKSPSAFLGENSSLVNLDRLLQPAAAPPAPPAAPPQHTHNPFADTPPVARPAQMFTQPPPARLTMNELKQQQMGLTGLNFGTASPAFGAPAPMPTMAAPLAPSGMAGGMAGAGLAPSLAPAGVAGADPWAPVAAPRSTSPWSPPHQRHTPNPFLS